MNLSSASIVLSEYMPVRIPAACISKEQGKRLWQEFGDKINVSEPSFRNDDQWELTSQGWVGFIPFTEQLSFFLEPKIPLKNLFGMWEYAYRLKSLNILEELFSCETLQQFYEQLANVLTKRILDRGRKGFHREYISRSEDLSFLRGRMDLRRMMNKPWEPRPRCDFQENTADNEDNQILAWTLYAILRSGYCSEKVLPVIRHAYRHLSQITLLQPFTPRDCIGRFYNRLNYDYQPLHALSWFFLENTGPSYELGDRTMLPFLFNMANLYELFVTEWLRIHLPPEYELSSQEHYYIDKNEEISFRIDLIIYESITRKPVCILDTKYKNPEKPSADDISQVGFYAVLKNCNEAILVYPNHPAKHIDDVVHNIRIRTVTFSLDGDLEKAGTSFLAEVLRYRNPT